MTIPTEDAPLIMQATESGQQQSFAPISAPKAHTNRIAWFYVVGILLNILYLPSIFDTYFSSILTTNITPIPQIAQAPAERIVMFLLDGTRADIFFGFYPNGQPVTPFIRNIIQTKGSYGVSYSKAPTESRVCAISVMAGFHEDPNAITKMWKEIPTPFDHLFNHTSYAWAAGTPDIVTLFPSSGNRKQTVNISGYPDDDIAIPFGRSPHIIDKMLIKDFAAVLNTTDEDKILNQKFKTPKIGFLFHLIAADIAADMFWSTSDSYYRTLSIHDQLINDTVARLEAFYNDSKTAYIVTADHGTFDRGGHGDGSLNTTRAPFVAWGAGVSRPVQEKVKGESHDEYSRPWNLEGLLRRDIHQIDIPSLASSLIGVPVPVNNLGTLPVEYLDVDKRSQSEFLLTNTKQVCAIYQKQNQDRSEQEPIFFSYKVSAEDVDSAITSIQNLIQAGEYQQAQDQSHELLENCKAGNTYLLRYDWLLLFSLISLGYIGYSLLGFTTVAKNFLEANAEELYVPQKRMTLGKLIYLIFSVGLLIFLALRESPLWYYIYAIFPLYFWFDLLFSGRYAFKNTTFTKKHIGYAILALVCLEVLVWAQLERKFLSLVCLTIAVWQIIDRINTSKKMLILWTVSCLAMIAFPLMPPIGPRNALLYNLGSLLTIGIVITGSLYYRAKMSRLSIISIVLVIASFLIAYHSDSYLTSGGQATMFNKVVAWIILIISIPLPLIFGLNSKGPFMLRLLVIFTCLSPSMILLSISYEILLFACLAVQLAVWVRMEKSPHEESEQPLNLNCLKNGTFILFFASIAFFGLINLANMDIRLQSGFRFIKVFSPSIMGCFLIIRILVPFILIAIAMATVGKFYLRLLSMNTLVIPVISLAAILTLNVFLLVKNTGSWLEMGNSVARYIISSLFIVIILGLAGVGYLLMKRDKRNKENWSSIKLLERPSFEDREKEA